MARATMGGVPTQQQLADRPPAQRPDASMSLLTDLFEHSVEPEYADVAARLKESGQPPKPARLSWRLALVTLVLALLFTTAVSHVRSSAERVSEERASLISRIEERNAYTDRLEQRLSELEQENLKLQAAQFEGAAEGQAARDELTRAQMATGTVPVTGPGISIVIENPDPAQQTVEGGEYGRVLDIDLQRVANGLWAAGAEAISINGQRLTALSAIRNADQVVLVNYRPLNPPYTVRAIGDPDTLPSRFSEGEGGEWLRNLASLYGMKFEVRTEDNLELPARTAGKLRFVDLGEDR